MHANIKIKVGDITEEKVCAIVNAANSSLMGGGGVDGAIHRAGGTAILEACKKIRRERYPEGLPTGQAVATTAGKMDTQYVIHTVGPVYPTCVNKCESLLGDCYTNALKIAKKLGCRDIVFPAISTGVYGYPKDQAARIAYRRVKTFLEEGNDIKITFIFHSEENKAVFEGSILGY